MVRKKFSESSVLFIILGSLILLGFVAYIQDPLLVYFNPDDYKTQPSYEEYTEVFEGDGFEEDGDFEGDDDMNGGEVDDSYGGEASNMIDILKESSYICYLTDDCTGDAANSIKALKAYDDIAAFRKDCPIDTMRYREFEIEDIGIFDCSDYFFAALLCARNKDYNVCGLHQIRYAERKIFKKKRGKEEDQGHVLNIVEVKLKEDERILGEDLHKFCTDDLSYPAYNRVRVSEGKPSWDLFPNCCWIQEGNVPIKELSNGGREDSCVSGSDTIDCSIKKPKGSGETCFLDDSGTCEELKEVLGDDKCVQEWKKLIK